MSKTVFENAELLAKRRDAVRISELQRKRIRPVNKWVLVRKAEVKDLLTDQDLLIPGEQQRSQGGIVVAVAENPPYRIEVGDEVIVTNFPIELNDLERVTGDPNLLLVRFEEIYAVLEPIEAE